MPCWYSGLPLLQTTPEIQKFLKELVPYSAIVPNHFALPWARPWNNDQEHLPEFPPLEINRLWMPSGANRFGIFYGLVDAETIDQIRDKTYGLWEDGSGGITDQPYELVMSDADASLPSFATYEVGAAAVRYEMYMLPPRPLSYPQLNSSGLRTVTNLWLIILVDERYIWWKTDTDNWGIDPRHSWDDVFESCRVLLGIDAADWECDPVPADYQLPDDFIAKASYQPVPIVLEAACWSTNRRVVILPKPYSLDEDIPSKIQIQEPSQGASSQTGGLAGQLVVSGGLLEIVKNPTTFNDAGGILPKTLRMTFPELDEDGNVIDGKYQVSYDVDTFDGYEAYKFTVGTITFQATMGHDADNTQNCKDVAKQFFTDWLAWSIQEYVDITLPGLKNISLSGCYDSIEWIDNFIFEKELLTDKGSGTATVAAGKIPRSFTRIYRPGYDARPITLHYASAGAGSGGSEGSEGSAGTTPETCQTYTIVCGDGSMQVVVICSGDLTDDGGGSGGPIQDPPGAFGEAFGDSFANAFGGM